MFLRIVFKSNQLNYCRYECVAVQEDGEEATTFVDLSVIFAPIVEQEEAYVRRRDGGREVANNHFKVLEIYEMR